VTPADRARSAFRDSAEIGTRADFIGFRVALDLDGRPEVR
jgi:formylglycine-generating enzyme required for sulfatase activity